MTDAELDAIEGRAATLEPFRFGMGSVDGKDLWEPYVHTTQDPGRVALTEEVCEELTAALSALPTDVPALVAEVRRLRAYESAADGITTPAVLNELARLRRIETAAQALIGPGNIGKTVDLSINWDGAISAIMEGRALARLRDALAAP